MHAVQTDRLELAAAHHRDDEGNVVRAAWPLSRETGSRSTAAVYFELERGMRLGSHTDSAEEVLYIVEGTGEAVVGEERVDIEAGSLALGPSMVPHDVVNTGDETIRVVGFFSSATVISEFEDPFQPIDANLVVAPAEFAPVKREAVPA